MLHLLLAVTMAVATPSPAPRNQREITFTSKDGSVLSGTLSWPVPSPDAPEGAPSPTFVLIGGSGMQDRDETIGPNTTLADVAAALNAAGITVLRYDKRGVAKSSSATSLAGVTRQDYIDDILAAVGALKNDPHVDTVPHCICWGTARAGSSRWGAVLDGAPVRGIVMMSAAAATLRGYSSQNR